MSADFKNSFIVGFSKEFAIVTFPATP